MASPPPSPPPGFPPLKPPPPPSPSPSQTPSPAVPPPPLPSETPPSPPPEGSASTSSSPPPSPGYPPLGVRRQEYLPPPLDEDKEEEEEDDGVIPPSPSPSTTLLRQYMTAETAENRQVAEEKIKALKYCIVTTHQEYCIVTSLTRVSCRVLVHRSASRLQQKAIKKSHVSHYRSQTRPKDIRIVVFEQSCDSPWLIPPFYEDV